MPRGNTILVSSLLKTLRLGEEHGWDVLSLAHSKQQNCVANASHILTDHLVCPLI